MTRTKVLFGVILALLMLAFSVTAVSAAPAGQEETPTEEFITGTVTAIEVEVDLLTGETTVLVTLADEEGATQTVRISVETAASLNLVTVESQIVEVLVPVDTMIGQTITVDVPPDILVTGVVDAILVQTDPVTLETTVALTLTDADAVTQTIVLSVDVATGLGLVQTVEQTVEVVTPNEAMIGQLVEIDPALVLTDGEEVTHPVALALGEYFANLFDVDAETIMGYHEDGLGFGVIAQAGFMAYALEGDAELMGTILDARQNGDFSAITLPDGTTAANWGQFRKAVLGGEKPKNNLGSIMSGRAAAALEAQDDTSSGDDGTGEATTLSMDDNDNGKGKGKSGAKGNHGKGKNK